MSMFSETSDGYQWRIKLLRDALNEIIEANISVTTNLIASNALDADEQSA